MRRLMFSAAMVAALLLTAAPTSAASYTVWHATATGPVLTGGSTITERPAGLVRLTVIVDHVVPGLRPVVELVGAACHVAGPWVGVALMAKATAAGVSAGLETFTIGRTAIFNSWIKAGKTISVHVIGPEHLTQSCGNLVKV